MKNEDLARISGNMFWHFPTQLYRNVTSQPFEPRRCSQAEVVNVLPESSHFAFSVAMCPEEGGMKGGRERRERRGEESWRGKK